MYYSGYSKEELMPTVLRLAKTISGSFLKYVYKYVIGHIRFSFRSNKMEAIRNKYRGVKFMKVADLPELKGEVGLKFLLSQFTNYS